MHASPSRLRHPAVVVLLAVLAAVATVCGSTAPARAADGDVTWTVRTAANGYGDDRSSFSYTVNPGGTVKDEMVVADKGGEPLTLTLYAADGFTTDKGQLDVLTKGAKSTGVGAWVRPAKSVVTIGAGKTATVPFTVRVPANATPGDHVGAVLTSLRQADDTEGINVDRRLGIRVRLRVSGPLKPALAVENLRVAYDGTAAPFAKGDATVTYTLHNTGNAMLSGNQKVRLEGPFGTLRTDAPKIAAAPQLLPGERWKVSVKVHDVPPAVRLTATATVTPLLTDDAGSTSSLRAVTATAGTWAVPWTLLALVVLLLAAAAGAFLLVRRSRSRGRAREDARVREAVDRALRVKEKDAKDPGREGTRTG